MKKIQNQKEALPSSSFAAFEAPRIKFEIKGRSDSKRMTEVILKSIETQKKYEQANKTVHPPKLEELQRKYRIIDQLLEEWMQGDEKLMEWLDLTKDLFVQSFIEKYRELKNKFEALKLVFQKARQAMETNVESFRDFKQLESEVSQWLDQLFSKIQQVQAKKAKFAKTHFPHKSHQKLNSIKRKINSHRISKPSNRFKAK